MSTETELVKQRDLNSDRYLIELREALNKKGIGIGINFDDKFLVKFLRAKVYNINETCDLLKMYISNFQKFPEFFNGVEYSRKAVESGVFRLFPHKNVTGERIANMCVGKWEPDEVSFESFVAATVYAVETAELEEDVQLNGVIEIVDCSHVGIKQFTKIGISQLSLIASMTEGALPIRWKKIFVCNENYLIDILYKIAKPLISKELKEKVEFIGTDFSKLHKEIPKHLLPACYDGTCDKDDPVNFFEELKTIEPQLLKLWQPFKQTSIK